MNILIRKLRSAYIRARRFIVSARFGASPDTVYGDEFYTGGGFNETERTAKVITGYLMQKYAPDSVLDVGCGMGNYLNHFSAAGCFVLGIEGSSSGVARVPLTVLAMQHDLRSPLVTNLRFGLVMCIEVAEHLPHRSAATLVRSICESARELVLFTAAPPGTPGTDHINCKPRSYWDRHFNMLGFTCDDVKTAELRRVACENDVATWFKEWSYIYRRGAPNL